MQLHAFTFPHTFSRPLHATTRLHISPYVLRGSPILLSGSINPTPILPRLASGAADPQPILPNRCPGPASRSSKFSASQVAQIPHTCEVGVAPARTRARPWACTRISVPRSYLHGHARAFTAMVTSLRLDPHASDETSADGLRKPTHSTNSLKLPAPTRGAWASGYDVASRCDDGVGVAVGACTQARLKAGSCGPDPRGTGAGRTRQKSADAAPDPQDE